MINVCLLYHYQNIFLIWNIVCTISLFLLGNLLASFHKKEGGLDRTSIFRGGDLFQRGFLIVKRVCKQCFALS